MLFYREASLDMTKFVRCGQDARPPLLRLPAPREGWESGSGHNALGQKGVHDRSPALWPPWCLSHMPYACPRVSEAAFDGSVNGNAAPVSND